MVLPGKRRASAQKKSSSTPSPILELVVGSTIHTNLLGGTLVWMRTSLSASPIDKRATLNVERITPNAPSTCHVPRTPAGLHLKVQVLMPPLASKSACLRAVFGTWRARKLQVLPLALVSYKEGMHHVVLT